MYEFIESTDTHHWLHKYVHSFESDPPIKRSREWQRIFGLFIRRHARHHICELWFSETPDRVLNVAYGQDAEPVQILRLVGDINCIEDAGPSDLIELTGEFASAIEQAEMEGKLEVYWDETGQPLVRRNRLLDAILCIRQLSNVDACEYAESLVRVEHRNGSRDTFPVK